MNGDNEEVRTTRLGDLLSRVHALSLELDDQSTVASLDSLATLKNLHQRLQEAGEKLFVRLLMGGKFKLAERLPSFYYLLDNYLEMALQIRNHHLLDFILRHGDININNQEVHVKGKVYPSAVHCCLGCDTKTTPMIDCLSVLIEHDASLFGSDESGLPIAHTILSTNHPLKKAFSVQREKTIESITFYKQLVSTLKLYIEQNQLPRIPQAICKSVAEAIDRYQSIIEELKLGIIPSNSSEKRLKDQWVNFTDKHNTAIMERVRQDVEVIALKKKLQIATKAFHNKLNPTQHRLAAKESSDHLASLDQKLDQLEVKFDDYKEVKQKALDYLEHSLAFLEKQTELFELQEEIRSCHIRPNRISKRYKGLLAKQALLKAEIAEMDQKYPEDNTEKIKSLDRLSASLSDLNLRLSSMFGGEQDTALDDFSLGSKEEEVNNNLKILSMFAPFLESIKGFEGLEDMEGLDGMENLSDEEISDPDLGTTNPGPR